MKKLLAVLLAVVMIISLAACKKDGGSEVKPTEAPQTTEAPKTTETPDVTDTPAVDNTPVDIFAKSEGVMTFAEYKAAPLESEVTVETFIQDKQSWWDNKGTFYTQDNEGGYFLYEMACTEEEYNKLVPGTKVKVTGFKSEWSGEVEIIDATYEIEEGTYIAEAKELTDLGTESFEAAQNMLVSFKGMTVAPQADGSAFLYSWDGSGSHDSNSDLYFTLSKDGQNYSFTVESYLRYNYTDVYAAVENLKVGDIVDVEAFVYWYNGPQPHVTGITVNGNIFTKSEGVMTFAEYAAAELESEVTVETFIQDKQSWWDNQGTFYTQDNEGGYFLYNMPCSEDEYNKLVPGTKIKVTGYKSAWSGEVEIIDATYEIEDGCYIAVAKDITDTLGTDALESYQNMFVSFKDMTVAAQADGSAFLYNWDGSGSHDSNSDLYFTLSKDGKDYSFTVESYLRYNYTDVYAAVESLAVGDVVDVEAFLYWYNGSQPHVTSIIKK